MPKNETRAVAGYGYHETCLHRKLHHSTDEPDRLGLRLSVEVDLFDRI
jgi:hypothetical protein